MINWKIIIGTAILIEIFTLVLRFTFDLKAPILWGRTRKKLGMPFLIRVHHFFIGILGAIIGYLYSSALVFNIGLGISLSDVIHHLILKLITGDSEIFRKENNKRAKRVVRGREK